MQIVLLFFPDLGKLFDMCEILSFFLFFLIKRWKIPENRKIDRKKKDDDAKTSSIVRALFRYSEFPTKEIVEECMEMEI